MADAILHPGCPSVEIPEVLPSNLERQVADAGVHNGRLVFQMRNFPSPRIVVKLRKRHRPFSITLLVYETSQELGHAEFLEFVNSYLTRRGWEMHDARFTGLHYVDIRNVYSLSGKLIAHN